MTSSEEPEESDLSEDAELGEEEQETEPSTEQDTTEETAHTETPTLSDGQEPAPTPLPPVQVPDRYEIHRCKLNFSITMLEDDGHSDGRQVLIGIRNDEDVPLTELVRASDLPALLPALVTLQTRLENDLHQRQETMRIKLEEARQKQQETKATPKREAKPRPAPTISAETPTTPQPATIVETTPPVEAATPIPQVAAKTPTKTKQKATQQEDESPFEQMTLFG